MPSLMPLRRLAAQRALRSRTVSPLPIRQFTASTTRPAGNTGSGNIISDAGTQQDSSPGSETGGSREHALDKGNKGDPNVQSDASGSARRYVRSQDSAKVQQHYATPFMNLRTGTEGFNSRHGNGDEEVVYERTYADAMRSAKAQDTGGQAVREKDERNATAKAKEEFPEAPDVVIGMQDERGGKAELRNHIYELVLQEPRDSIFFAFISGLNNAPIYRPKIFYFYLPPPIIQVNRIIRAETLWLWYSDRELRSTLDGPRRLRVCKEWLAVHASHLPFVERVVVGDSWPYDDSEVWTRYKDDDYDLAANEGLGV
ncbi:hypothetical protein LTR32_006988 [Rachicladosporium monterosium]|uniref:Uncharacterized protein n=1 Tax=Rachicladosporium monterosium TaxID=1507873 RepID=A0ABR0KXA7_9PEZI|nr:hypothetical protein LTR32_006988 [Rachicladosporium monterosium]